MKTILNYITFVNHKTIIMEEIVKQKVAELLKKGLDTFDIENHVEKDLAVDIWLKTKNKNFEVIFPKEDYKNFTGKY